MTRLKELQRHLRQGFLRLVIWRERHITERTFVIVLSLLVGVLGGFAALVLKKAIYFINGVLLEHISITGGNYDLLIYPVIGIVLVACYVRYWVRDDISHGVTRVLYAISQNKSRLKPHNMYTNVVASSVTIGFGGSVGSEGPIVYTGAAIGSNVGQWFRMSPKILMILVGCGASAGMAAMFKAPIAGMLFTIEVLMLELNTVSIMPLLIASITAATVAYTYQGYDAIFFFVQSETFVTGRIPYVILLGVFCGLTSLYFTKSMISMENLFGRIKRPWRRTIVGCLIVSTLIFLFPPLFGEGYHYIGHMLSGQPAHMLDDSIFFTDNGNPWVIFAFAVALLLVKSIATSSTNGAGGVGGTFAPTLYVGAMTGFVFAFLLNTAFGLDLSIKNFTLIGMAGVMAGVMHAPLMAIFLVAELTGGYQLFLPLLISSTIAYITIKIFIPYNIYSIRLARRGELMTHHKDKAVLTLLKVQSVIENDFTPVTPDMNLKQMVQVISQSSRNLFPVLNDDKELIGVVLLDDIRNIMFRPDLYKKMTVSKFMAMPPARIDIGETMEVVMKKFDDTGAWNLPVVDGARYIGFVSKSKIFNSYRRVLRHYSED